VHPKELRSLKLAREREHTLRIDARESSRLILKVIAGGPLDVRIQKNGRTDRSSGVAERTFRDVEGAEVTLSAPSDCYATYCIAADDAAGRARLEALRVLALPEGSEHLAMPATQHATRFVLQLVAGGELDVLPVGDVLPARVRADSEHSLPGFRGALLKARQDDCYLAYAVIVEAD
jgi:hypothetical protein